MDGGTAQSEPAGGRARFAAKVAVVTGSGSGIGRATAELFAGVDGGCPFSVSSARRAGGLTGLADAFVSGHALAVLFRDGLCRMLLCESDVA